jgi:GNAT superfamily N-acetyltransferase
MNIRFATPTDKTPILELLSQLGKTLNKNFGFDPKNENAIIYGSENYDNVISRDDIKIFLIEDKNIILGLSSFFIYHDMITGEKYAHIDDFIVSKDKRNSGLGTMLMQGIVEYAKHNDFTAIKLISFPEVEEFYKKCGAKRSNISMRIDLK